MSQNQVVVIGAGVGGLSAALDLRRRGYEVVVLERHDEVGGKASARDWQGYRWDEGPSIIVMTWVYDELFQSAGLDPAAYLTFDRLDPVFRIVLSDGRAVEIGDGEDGLHRAIEGIDPTDADAVGPFLRKVDRYAKVIGRAYCDRILSSWGQVMLSPLLLSAAVISPQRTYMEELHGFFKNPSVRELFHGFPTYSGFAPDKAPAPLVLVPWTIVREGVFYPREPGGVSAIPRAIARACQDLGVEIRLGVEVEAIERDARGAVKGVATSHGWFETSLVVSNSEYIHTYRMLRGGPTLTEPSAAMRDGDARPSTSFFTIQLACDRAWPQTRHHLLMLTQGSHRVYDEIFLRGEYPSDPPLYLNTTSVTAPGDAPAGGSNPFLVVGAPALRPGASRDSAAELAYAERLLDTLERAELPGLRASIQSMKVTTPWDWQSRFHAFRGSIYGLGVEHNVLGGGFRPINYLPEVPGLYFSGGSVQPGPGLPMVCQSGKLVAAQIARDAPRTRRIPASVATG